MSSKKLITELSIDELINLSQKEDQQVTVDPVKDKILQFIMVYNLKKGDFKLEKKYIYRLFKAWNIERYINNNVFIHYLDELMDLDRDSKFIHLDKSLMNLTEIAFNALLAPKRNSKNRIGKIEKDIKLFLSTFNFKSGSYYSPMWTIYQAYKSWAGINKKIKMQYARFNKVFRTKFKIELHEGKGFTYIDKATVDALESFMKNAKEEKEKKKLSYQESQTQ